MRVKMTRNRKDKIKKSWTDCLKSRRNCKKDLTRKKDLLQQGELDLNCLRKAEMKVPLWSCRENGQEEKTLEIQDPQKKVETGQDL